jgi:hypothetical protein
MKKLHITFLLLIGIGLTQAQVSAPTGFMHYNPYFSDDNPARFTHANGYVGVPGISNLQINLLNSLFKLNHLLHYDSEGYPTTIDLDRWVNNLQPNNNWLKFNLNEQLLGFGFRQEMLFFTVGLNLKADAGLQTNKDFFGFFVKGNMNYLGEDEANLKATLNANVYAELSLGVQAEVNKRLYIGVRPRLLLGLAQVRTNKLQATIHTDPETYNVQLNYTADVEVRSILPLKAENNVPKIGSFSDIMGNIEKNLGFAIDFGALYRIGSRFGVELAVNDLGFIHWRTGGLNFHSILGNGGSYYENGNFNFTGLSASMVKDMVNGNMDQLNDFLDSLNGYFPNNIDMTSSKQNMMLNTRINLGGYFDLTPKHRFMVQMQGHIIGKSFLPAVTVAYSGRISDYFDISVPYTIMPGSYDNLGLGLGFNIFGLYIYVASHDILAFRRGFGSQVNCQMGIVINWGYKKAQEKSLKVKKVENENENENENKEK